MTEAFVVNYRMLSESFQLYWQSLQRNIPVEVYEGLLSVGALALVVLICIKGFVKGLQLFGLVLLLEYTFIVLCSTLFYRQFVETRGHCFTPFWSYGAIYDGQEEILQQCIMNVVAYVPIGFLLYVGFYKIKWWKALLVGMGISLFVESFQFIYKRGFSEVDDVFHNSLGCMIGYFIMLCVANTCLMFNNLLKRNGRVNKE